MATETSTTTRAPASAVLLHNLTNLAIIGVIAFVIWMAWPMIMARFFAEPAPIAQPTQAPAPTMRPQVVVPAPPVIIQRVEAAEPAPPPPVVNIPPQAPPAPVEGQPVIAEPAPPPAPVVIVHRQSEEGHQTITGQGACAVGGSVARRCGK